MTKLTLAGLCVLFAIPSVSHAAIDESVDSSAKVILPAAISSAPSELHRFNIQTSPVGMMVGRVNLAIEVGLSNSLVLGVKGTYLRMTGVDSWITQDRQEEGLRLTYYPTGRRFENGLILRGGALYGSWQSPRTIENALNQIFGSGERQRTLVNSPVLEAGIGYQVGTRSGINFDFSAGVSSYMEKYQTVSLSSGQVVEDKSSGLIVTPVVEVNVGYAF